MKSNESEYYSHTISINDDDQYDRSVSEEFFSPKAQGFWGWISDCIVKGWNWLIDKVKKLINKM